MWCVGFSLRWQGIFCCRAWALGLSGSVVVAHRLVDLKHVGFSWTRDSTRVPCIGRRILNHWTAREVLMLVLIFSDLPKSTKKGGMKFNQDLILHFTSYKCLILLFNESFKNHFSSNLLIMHTNNNIHRIHEKHQLH